MAATFVGLGTTTIAVPGTPQRLSIPASVSPTNVHALLLQVLSSNVGKVYIGTAGLNKSTLAAVLAVLPAPSGSVLPVFTTAMAQAANALPLGSLWVDADNGGDGILGSVIVA